eukprot:CAMPEP_0118928236 /NCGR_PEP_ID=MMETSP1169-20130426/5538_1 /TAXON_ID=36882 /ORGANISM="Pyramimonas obovata, Strain CCMP722" /LENGTH=54 /DNA_ID=CAMNT_0006870163 /DNA_START=539 /DNA_END=701 /DNA_ORIENTATION=+
MVNDFGGLKLAASSPHPREARSAPTAERRTERTSDVRVGRSQAHRAVPDDLDHL